ncbi:LuxR C-terminal-related transcriptional regulator [Nocardioides mesophilus]|uniref:Helix-turn-helix transcriptional regulator n=1 Tax=Nocardioides mesophilus TaxID=433659 RepID=A0A7G9RB44_9ACTN|nr:LuxR C-terminal-related transcriptional regulator [Nocardioides mesophilus]QNN52819.1 helix-turn-helix transcriptional regulator [Nocardioides mesophilus]
MRYQIPDLPSAHVRRPRLLAVLGRSETLPLVVVSAPAGTGKTTLVAEWVRCSGSASSTGWVSLEDGDTDLWAHLLASLDRLGVPVEREVGRTDGTAPDHRDWLLGLATRLARAPRRLTIVLDGYELASLDVAHDLDFVLRHSLGRLRLVVVGRVDPVLPLYRYRLEDQLVEVRVSDLAFDDDEAAELLTRLAVHLSPSAVRDLNDRTKGWVAGLRFAGRALVDRPDAEERVAEVVSQTHDINEYLVGEVLDAHPPQVRRLMLDTCVPDVLCAGLAEELGGPRAPHLLADLARANAFIEEVPGQPGSYRYYPFFRDLLRAQLAYESPRARTKLHRRTARWLRLRGHAVESLIQLARLGAWDSLAIQLVEDRLTGRLLVEGPGSALAELAGRLPSELVRPEVVAARAAVALAAGDHLRCAEELAGLPRQPSTETEATSPLWQTVRMLDAVRASRHDGVDAANAAVDAADAVLRPDPVRALPPAGAEMRALVLLSKGVARLRRGDLEPARQALAGASRTGTAAQHPGFRAECLAYQSVVEAWQGRLSRARAGAEEAISLAGRTEAPGVARSPVLVARLALARIALDRYDLRASQEQVTAVRVGVDHAEDGVSLCLGESVSAGLQAASGHPVAALARLETASARLSALDSWLAEGLRVEAARVLLSAAKPQAAVHELAAVTSTPHADRSLVLAQAQAEQGDASAARLSLAQVEETALAPADQVSRLLAQVATELRTSAPDRARGTLDRALRLASREQLRRPFHEAAPAVRQLIASEPRLLAEQPWFAGPGPRAATKVSASPSTAEPVRPEVLERLTPRELEVLGHLEALLSTDEIAEKMFVSVNTVRTHVRSILRKLGVNRRNAAVRRAREIGILGS